MPNLFSCVLVFFPNYCYLILMNHDKKRSAFLVMVLILSHFILFYLKSYPMLSYVYLIIFYLTLHQISLMFSCFILCYLLFYLVLSAIILSFLILSCLSHL